MNTNAKASPILDPNSIVKMNLKKFASSQKLEVSSNGGPNRTRK